MAKGLRLCRAVRGKAFFGRSGIRHHLGISRRINIASLAALRRPHLRRSMARQRIDGNHPAGSGAPSDRVACCDLGALMVCPEGVEGRAPDAGGMNCANSDDHQLIFIDGLELRASIGGHPHERQATQIVRIDIELAVAPPLEHRIGATVDYEKVAQIMRMIVASGHFGLVQSLANANADRLLADTAATSVALRLFKPRVITGAYGAGVRIWWSRETRAA